MHARALTSGVLFLFATLAGPTLARADLPARGWPQQRCDAARTARSPENALPSARMAWAAFTGAELTGEPAVLDCTASIVDANGVVHAFNARSGEPLWTHDAEHAVTPAGVSSALAFDDSGRLHAGIPADPMIALAWHAVSALHSALRAFAVDNNAYPPGPDLAAALVPTYLREIPLNGVTSQPAVHSDTPSPGDYRYASHSGGLGFHLGAWSTDDGLLASGPTCGPADSSAGGLDPSWPVSARQGGTPTALEVADGRLAWEDRSVGSALVPVPGVTRSGVAWSFLEHLPRVAASWFPWTADLEHARRVRLHDGSGGRTWETDVVWGGARGGAAFDTAENAHLAFGPGRVAEVIDDIVQSLAAAVEAHAIDNNEYPPAGELEPLVAPVYLRCMPPNVFTGATAVFSASPSPGDYDYSTNGLRTEYRLAIWGADGSAAAVFDTGAFEQQALDLPPGVESFDSTGGRRWSVAVGQPTEDVTPPALTPDGAVVVGTTSGALIWLEASTGDERQRADVGQSLVTAPALLPDGGPVVVTTNGTVVAFDPDGGERWRRPLGVAVVASPTTTADGFTYVPDLAGVLHAVDSEGDVAWTSDLGGPTRAGLTTSAVQSDGWLFVGRSDGALLALVPRETGGLPEDPSLLLPSGVKSRTTAGFAWPDAPLPNDPGAHFHLRRWRETFAGVGEDVLAAHPSLVRDAVDTAADGELLFYNLLAADCAENESVR